MHKYLIIAIIFLSVAACNSSKPGKDLIPPETLVPVLIDMHITYALQTTSEFRQLARYVDSVDTYGYIYDKHNISREMFDSTLVWYSRHPKLFTDIYDEVIMQLTKLHDSITPNPAE
jgi:hypothetical protein